MANEAPESYAALESRETGANLLQTRGRENRTTSEECRQPEDMMETAEGETAAGQASGDDHRQLKAVWCVNSSHGTASTFCEDCSELYCQLCSSSHGLFPSLRNHKVVSIEVMSEADLKQATEKTPEPDLRKHSCQACQTVVCGTCFMLKGKDHRHEELMEAAREARKHLKQMIDGASAFMIRQRDVLSEMGKDKDRFRNEVQAAKEQVRDAARMMHDIVRSQETILTDDLERLEAQALTRATPVLETATLSMSKVSEFKREMEKLYHSGRALDQVLRTPKMMEEFGKQAGESRQVKWALSMERRQPAEEALRAMLGQVQLKCPSSKTCIDLGNPLQSVLLDSYGQGLVVTGMVVVGDHILCVVFREIAKLLLHDMQHGRGKMRSVEELQNPRGMALLESAPGTLVIADGLHGASKVKDSDGSSSKLHFVTVSSSLEISQHAVKVIPVGKVCRVSVVPDTGQLLIGQWESGRFAICNHFGEHQKSVSLPNAHGLSVICATQVEGPLAALTLDSNWGGTVRWLDEHGSCSHIYGLVEEERLDRATHMIGLSDSGGQQLIVVDRGHNRLHLVGANHQLSQYLLTEADGICQPRCVCLDKGCGRLYVAHGRPGSQEVRVYGWPSRSMDTGVTSYELNVQLGTFS